MSFQALYSLKSHFGLLDKYGRLYEVLCFCDNKKINKHNKDRYFKIYLILSYLSHKLRSTVERVILEKIKK